MKKLTPGFLLQLRLLLWKNFTIKRRNPIVFLVEVLLPLVLVLVLVLIRQSQHAQQIPASHYQSKPLPSAGLIPILQLFCDTDGDVYEQQNDRLKGVLNQIQTVLEVLDTLRALKSKDNFQDLVNENGFQDVKVSRLIRDEIALAQILSTYNIDDDISASLLRSSLNISQILAIASPYIGQSSFDGSGMIAELVLSALFSNDAITDVTKVIQHAQIQETICSTSVMDNTVVIPSNIDDAANMATLLESICGMDREKFVKFVKDVAGTVDDRFLVAKTIKNIKTVINKFRRLIGDWKTGGLNSCPAVQQPSLQKNSTKDHTRRHKYGGLIRFWKLLEPTLCGQKTEVTSHHEQNGTTTEEEDDYPKLCRVLLFNYDGNNLVEDSMTEDEEFTQQQMKYLTLVKNVMFKNPKILYAPNNSVVQSVIKKANESFMFYDVITGYARQWLNKSGQMRNDISRTLFLNPSQWPRKSGLPENIWMNSTIDMLDSMACMWLGLIEDIDFDIFKGFKTETELEEYFLTRQYHDNVTVIAGIVFDNIDDDTETLPAHVRYKIRQNATLTAPTNLARSRIWAPSPGSDNIKYYDFGFVWIQDMVERTIIDLHVGRDVPAPGNYIKRIPYPCWPFDSFVWNINHILPLALMMSWVYTVCTLVQRIVHEKEKRLKEVMKMMGLTSRVHWCAWFITAFIQMTLLTLAITLMLHYGRVLPYSDPVLVFIFIELFAISLISFSFLMSSFYSKSRLAAACAGIFYFLSYVPYIYISIKEGVTYIQISGLFKFIVSIFSTSAFGLGGKYFLYYEIEGVGVQWSNLSMSPEENDSYSLLYIMLMLVFDTALYGILTWYIENIHPGTYGIPKPWYFPVTPSYWFGQSSTVTVCGLNRWFRMQDDAKYTRLNQFDDDPLILETDSGGLFEEETSGHPVGVEICDLRKVYSKGAQPAVDGLNLTLYENQITAFLGHNGAGKTTTMSILTGLFPPTSGTAFVYGHDISTEMDKVRQSLGMCPQHNILFDSLSVEEHLWFYARLKGMHVDDIEVESDRMLNDLGLSAKRSTMPECLSGGMQRKLSVAIAFVGGAKTVILDEPTAGVDPYSRRSIWKLLGQYKTGRTILLSTHHMDEADALGDRIAIISNGRLKCSGSSLFLKRTLGDGQHIHILKQPSDPLNLEDANRVEEILEGICEFVPKSFVKFESRDEGIITVPVCPHEKYKLAEICDRLCDMKNNQVIRSFGVNDSGLEEIFVKITEDAQFDRSVQNETDDRLECNHTGVKTRQDDIDSYPLDDTFHHSTDNVDCIIPMYQKSDSSSSSANIFKSVHIQKSRNPFLHFTALFTKRIRYTLRNRKSILSQIILPAVFVSISMTIALAAPKQNDPPKMTMSTGQYFKLTKPTGNFVPFHVENSDNANDGVRGSSELIDAVKYLPSGLGSDCLLSVEGRHSYESAVTMSRKIGNGHVPVIQDFYKPECREVFTRGLSISVHSNSSTDSPQSELIKGAPYYPICKCKKYSRFLCENKDIYDPPSFTVITGDHLQNISGLNEEDFYLYTTDKYKQHRYGGFSLGKNLPYVPEKLGQSKSFKSFINGLVVKDVARVRFDQNGYHSMPIYINALNNAILRAHLPKSKGNPAVFGITLINHPMKKTSSLLDTDYIKGGTDVLMAIFIIIAMSFVPASFVVFLVHERATKAKHLQFISGVRPITYWLSNLIWDMFNYLIPAICIIGILLAFRIPAYVGKGNIEAVSALFLVYGWSITPMMYPATFMFRQSSVAYISLIILNLFVGITCLVTSFILEIFSSDSNLSAINHTLKHVFLIFPNFCLGSGMMDIALNQYKNDYYFHIDQYDKIHSPMEWHITGKKLVAMATTGVFFFIFTILCEYGFFFKCRKQAALPTCSIDEEIDSDVLHEKQRVLHGPNEGDLLTLKTLVKTYRTRKRGRITAVSGLNMAVKKGECFGLLGVNGAGKTTTFKILTGDIQPSSGDAMLSGYSILNDKHLVQQQIGYCPQFDATFDELTPKEHLQLYARLHGIPSHAESKVVNWALEKLGLVRYSNQTSGTLSGGNKRKLSTAISLVGNPPLLLMDEPTAGMDPYSKKFLWKVIHDLVQDGKSVLFTSHSMEECEILCSRLSIMANGQLKCLGSIQQLKDKFGEGYTLKMTLASGGRIREVLNELHRLHREFKLKLKERGPKLLTFDIQCCDRDLGEIYRCLEKLVEQNRIVDYSLSQNTLDNVFIQFARQHSQLSNNPTADQDAELDEPTTASLYHSDDEPLIELAPRSVQTRNLCDEEPTIASLSHTDEQPLIELAPRSVQTRNLCDEEPTTASLSHNDDEPLIELAPRSVQTRNLCDEEPTTASLSHNDDEPLIELAPRSVQTRNLCDEEPTIASLSHTDNEPLIEMAPRNNVQTQDFSDLELW